MASTDMVAKALALAAPVTKASQDAINEKIEDIDEKLQAAKKMRSGLLGIEKHASALIAEQETKLVEARKELEATKITPMPGYKLMGLAPLSWRDRNGFPKLVLFSMDSPTVRFRCERRSEYSDEVSLTCTPDLPNLLAKHYQDVKESLRRKTAAYSATSISTTYNGILPEKIRDRIRAEATKWKHIYVLAEVKGWKVDQESLPKPGDPIVVGWDGEHLWVIDHYDLTPAEEHVLREFAV